MSKARMASRPASGQSKKRGFTHGDEMPSRAFSTTNAQSCATQAEGAMTRSQYVEHRRHSLASIWRTIRPIRGSYGTRGGLHVVGGARDDRVVRSRFSSRSIVGREAERAALEEALDA